MLIRSIGSAGVATDWSVLGVSVLLLLYSPAFAYWVVSA
jgi:hypothetical protein